MAMSAPDSARASAMARPMRLAAPVTSAVFPSKGFVFSFKSAFSLAAAGKDYFVEAGGVVVVESAGFADGVAGLVGGDFAGGGVTGVPGSDIGLAGS